MYLSTMINVKLTLSTKVDVENGLGRIEVPRRCIWRGGRSYAAR
jgi:hypothetical protein